MKNTIKKFEAKGLSKGSMVKGGNNGGHHSSDRNTLDRTVWYVGSAN